MISMDELLHEAYNSIEQEDGSWTYAIELTKVKKNIKMHKQGKRILDRKRGRLINDFQKELR